MRVFFVNRFYYPDISATSQMLTDLATGLSGHFDVTVITSRKLYNDPRAKLARQEVQRGVNIVRLNTTRLGRTRLWRRVFDYASFSLHVLRFLLGHVRKGDLVVLKTDPPLLSLLNTSAIRLRGGQVVNWLQDIFPEIAIELGAFPRNKLFSAPLIWWRNRTLKAAQTNVVISKNMQELLASEGVMNTAYIPNWADGERIQPIDHEDNPLYAQWNPDKKFLVGYSGNFGRAHSFDELIEAMQLLKDQQDIHFVLIGAGAALTQVREAVDRLNLPNVSFKPYQAMADLPNSLGVIDLHLVSLKPGMEGLVMPSKLYGVLAAGRPIAYIGDPHGEIARLIEANDLGFTVANGDGNGLAEHIRALASGPERARQYNANARAYFQKEFTLPQGVERWQPLLQKNQGEMVG